MTAHGEHRVNPWLDRAVLEEIRLADSLQDRRARRFVEDQLHHPDPELARVAQLVLDGERSVAALVDLVIDQGQFGYDAVRQTLNDLGPDLVDELRHRTGTDAASLRELLKPEPYEPSAEVRSHLVQAGITSLPSLDELRARLGIDPYAIFDLEGLEERQRAQTEPSAPED